MTTILLFASTVNATSLGLFMNLNDTYCNDKTLNTVEKLSDKLSNAKNFKRDYSTFVHTSDIAITSDEYGCTTDLMILNSENELIFTNDQLKSILISEGYTVAKSEIVITSWVVEGDDIVDVDIQQSFFKSPNGKNVFVEYPSNQQNKYYMTMTTEF